MQRATRERPPYDEALLAKALRDGIDPAGRRLARGMPRYELPESLFRNLRAYLADLSAVSARGITQHAVTFGVLAPVGSEKQAQDYADALRAALLSATEGRPVHRRDLRVILLSGTPAEMIAHAEEAVAAVVGIPRGSGLEIAAFTARGIPVLFPLFPLTGDEDVSLVRGLIPDEADALDALSDRIAGTGVKRLAVLDDDRCGRASSARAHAVAAHAGKTVDTVFLSVMDLLGGDGANADALLLLCENAQSAEHVVAATPPNVPIYGLCNELNHIKAIVQGRQAAYLAVERALLAEVMLTQRKSVSEAHAEIAGRIIGRALRSSGPKITSFSVVSAIGKVVIEKFLLNYTAYHLNGARNVLIIKKSSR